jgi:hypothetical protein
MGGNVPPELIASDPQDGHSYVRGEDVYFDPYAEDVEDGLISGNVRWISSIDGFLGTGFQHRRDLSFGTHTITATVTDSGGFSDSVTRTISIVDAPPVMTIQQPFNGSIFYNDQDIALVGSSFKQSNLVTHQLTDAQVYWRADSSTTNLATGHRAILLRGTLPVGTHTIRFIGSDGTFTASDSHTITIVPRPQSGGQPPTVSIQNPAANATVYAYSFVSGPVGSGFKASVTLQGSAMDPEDGALSGGSLVWTSDGGTPLAVGTNQTVDLVVYGVGANTVHLTLTATDSNGNTRTATVTITVYVDLARLV